MFGIIHGQMFPASAIGPVVPTLEQGSLTYPTSDIVTAGLQGQTTLAAQGQATLAAQKYMQPSVCSM